MSKHNNTAYTFCHMVTEIVYPVDYEKLKLVKNRAIGYNKSGGGGGLYELGGDHLVPPVGFLVITFEPVML